MTSPPTSRRSRTRPRPPRPWKPPSAAGSRARCVNLFERVVLYNQLENTVQLADSPGLAQELQAPPGPRGRPAPPEPGRGRPVPSAAAAARAEPRRLAEHRRGPGWPARPAAPGPDAPGHGGRRLPGRAARSLQPERGRTARARRQRPAPGPAPRRQREPVQPGPALLPGHGDLRAGPARPVRFLAGRRELLQAAAFSLLAAGAAGAHRGPGLAHHPPGPAAGHQPVLLGGVRRAGRAVVLGLVLERMYRQGLRHRGGGRGGVRLADHRPPPGHGGGHHGDDAGRAGLQLLAGHPRGDASPSATAAPSWPGSSPSPTPCASTSRPTRTRPPPAPWWT